MFTVQFSAPWLCIVTVFLTAAHSLAAPIWKPDTKAFTTGVEEVVIPLAEINFIPPAGWSAFTINKHEKKVTTTTKIASPGLLGRKGVMTCLVFPSNGTPLNKWVDVFAGVMKSQTVERVEKISASGIKMTYLHVLTLTKDGTYAHLVHCFFTNPAGYGVDLYCLGANEECAREAGAAFLKTIRFNKE